MRTLIIYLSILPVFIFAGIPDQDVRLLLEEIRNTSTDRPHSAIDTGRRALLFLSKSPDHETEIEILSEMGWAFINLNALDSAVVYSHRVRELASAHNFRPGLARAARINGRILRNQGDYNAALGVLDSGLSIIEKTPAVTLKSQLLNEIGTVYRRLSRFEEALHVHRQALALYQANSDKRGESSTFGLMGIVYDMIGNYDEALKHHQQSLEIDRALGDRRGVAASLNNLGILNQKVRDYPEALRLYRQALQIWEELNLEDQIATTYNNIGAIHELQGNNREAVSYYKRALEIWNRSGDHYSRSIALSNIGSIELKLGNYEEALNIFNETLAIYTRLGDRYRIAGSLNQLTDLYLQTEKLDSAIILAKKSLEIAEEVNSWSLLKQSYENLGLLYERTGNYREALEANKNYLIAHDSLFNEQSQKIIADLKTQYNVREQQQEIELLQKSRNVQQLWIGLLLGGISFLMVVALLLTNRSRLRQRAHVALRKMHEAEAEQARLRVEASESLTRYLQSENERQTRELQSARELQLSMLPAVLPDHPLYEVAASMHTATEVGGDYYDFNRADDGTLTVAIGDATGHGINAGTIVTATKSLFNLLSTENDLLAAIGKASAALKKMNFQKLFMAFALIRLKGDMVQLIGAGMPPAYIYRASNGSVDEFPLNGLPLGAYGNYPYRLRETQMQAGDVLVLVSDGYAELRNEYDEMIGFDRLKKELPDVGKSSPQEIIDHFIETAHQWCDYRPFTDDMTFVVIKMKE